MSRYFAILTPTTTRLFYAWIAVGMLLVYLVLPWYPNITLSGYAMLYFWMQFVLICGLLFPLLMRWRYCQVLRLMPNYNVVITKLVASLFGLFIVLPAVLAWFNNLNIWPVQTFSLLIWSVGSFIILRRLMLNAPSERQEKIMSSIVFPAFYLPFMVALNGGFALIVELTFLASIEFQLSLIALSIFIWLLPKKKYPHKQQRKSFSMDGVFFVPNNAKLVFAVLSNQSFLVAFCCQLLVVLFAGGVVYSSGSSELLYFTIFSILFYFPHWLQQKEKLASLLFLLSAGEDRFGKVIYRSFIHIYMCFSVLTGGLVLSVAYVIDVDIPLSALLLSILSSVSILYFLLRFSVQQVSLFIGMVVLGGALFLIRDHIEIVIWFNVGLMIFLTATYKFPPLNWLKVEYGFNPNKATM